MHYNACITHWARRIRGILFRMFRMLRRKVIWDMLWNTSIRLLWLTHKFSLKISSEFRIEHHYLRDRIFISTKLILQKFAIFCIYACLEFISFNTPVKAKLKVTEQVRHLAHIGSILNIDEVMLALLMADSALLHWSISSWEAILAEDAVAIKYEPSCELEAWMTFVSVHLEFFVHNRLILIIVIMSSLESTRNQN